LIGVLPFYSISSTRLFPLRDEVAEVPKMVKEKEGKKIEPIYEKLSPGEILLISKDENCVIYAVNKDGELKIRRVCLTEKES